MRLKVFSEALRIVGSRLGAVKSDPEYQRAEAEHQQAVDELARQWRAAMDETDAELKSAGLPPPGNDIEGWEFLARVVEKDPGPMTLQEIYVEALAWVEREKIRAQLRWKMAGEVNPKAPDGEAPNEASAVYLGNRRVQLGGDPPIVLDEAEDHVVKSLLELGCAANLSELRRQTGKGDAPRVLRAIRAKHPALAPFIIMPGTKGKGGYRTTISDGRQVN